MNISLNWVNDFVKLPSIDADDLANSFTMTTAEVEGVTTSFSHLKEIRVAQIKTVTKHPEADKLNLVTFDFGGKETKEVVCGAPNVREGLKIPYAPLGVTLPNGLTLEPKKIRGILSEGMLCSETELGTGEGTSGLMELPEDAVIGMPMIEFLKMEADTILDVDNKSLTHRPDLWGHYGIAREFSAAYEVDLADPYNEAWKKSIEAQFNKDKSPITPKVEADSACKAYWGLSVDNIKVGPSPEWMVNRLEACGLRSINSIVDVSNYVMLELGMPLHIFDRNAIKDNTIHIKRIGKEDTFKTLDEVDRNLLEYDTVICDSEKPLVLGGIMGGLNSGVIDETTSVFIEVANWTAEEVRKTSTRLGLRTDSSQRYEKSLDSLQCYKTLLRTYDLLKQLNPDAKIIGKPEYGGHDLSKIEAKVIKTSKKTICTTLGHEVPEEKLLSIFNRLDFKVKNSDGNYEITLPSFRTTKDIEYEACIIEEVGRVIGYDNIVPVSPKSDIQTTRFESTKSLHRKVQDFMVLNGNSLEILTYPLIGKKLLDKANWPVMNEELVLVNALSKDADRMRPSLVPHALNTVAVNAKNFDSFNFFELGRSYLPDAKNFSTERHQLIIGMFDKKGSPFVSLINTVEKLLTTLNINYDLTSDTGKFVNPLVSKEWLGMHPHENVNVRIMGKFHGVITSVHPLALRQFKAKGNFSFAVIDFTDFHSRELKAKTKYSPISKFPTSRFDCTVLVDKNIPVAETVAALKKIKSKEITEPKIVDVFSQDETHNAVTVTVTFEDPTKTLTSDFIKECEGKVVEGLAKAGYPLKS
ncbi:MAG: phenylalanyl-tRNA synthetase beta chain [Bacteriovoracaceae bacterium]